MKSLLKEIQLDKLEISNKRLRYLKFLSIVCLFLDLIPYITFETIEMLFSTNKYILIFFIVKVRKQINYRSHSFW
jgi:hypothetical protein